MNAYILVSELYHTGVKGMKWGIRKEYYKKESADSKKRSTIGGIIGAGVGAAGAVGIDVLLQRGHSFNKVGKNWVDNISGKSYEQVVSNIARKAVGAALVGAYLGKKIGKYSAKEQGAQERIDYMAPRKKIT